MRLKANANDTYSDDSEDKVVVQEKPEPVSHLIEKDVFNVVPVGSRAFKQLPVVDQARIYLMQNQQKVSKSLLLEYQNKTEAKINLQKTLRVAYAEQIDQESQ